MSMAKRRTGRKTAYRPNTAAGAGDRDERGRARKATIWLMTTVLTAVVGVVVTLNVDAIKAWFSEQKPLEIHVIPSAEAPPWYSVVVADPSRLPTVVGKIKDCARLLAIGLEAGGVRSDASVQRVLLRGAAKDGTTIVDMRAKITKRASAVDGALLQCPSAGSLEPIGLAFDLSKSDSAPAQRYSEGLERLIQCATNAEGGCRRKLFDAVLCR
jgi:hypothetical protein